MQSPILAPKVGGNPRVIARSLVTLEGGLVVIGGRIEFQKFGRERPKLPLRRVLKSGERQVDVRQSGTRTMSAARRSAKVFSGTAPVSSRLFPAMTATLFCVPPA
jgi:hypothetical protein